MWRSRFQFCVWTWEWCGLCQTAGLESWPCKFRVISAASLFGCRIGTINNEELQFVALKMCGKSVHIIYALIPMLSASHHSSHPTLCSAIAPFLSSYSLQPPLLRPDRASVLFSSSPSSFPSISDFNPQSEKKPITSLSCHNASNAHTHTPTQPWQESCCAVTPDPLSISGTKLCYNRLSLPS